MHLANATFEYLAYTPSNKHFGLSNTQLLLGIIGTVIVLWIIARGNRNS